MAGSLLREIGLPELITSDEASYVALAQRLGRDRAYREQVRARIGAAMAGRPRFLDPAAYGQALGRLLERIWEARPTSG
jgi:predicted O-linked N-acetylglucosamine transferase (SPINDLY family)